MLPLLTSADVSQRHLPSLLSSSPVPMMLGLIVLSLLPLAAVMLTSFSKIVVVLSLARSAMGTQQAPPTLILTGLAAVLSGHIMAPVVDKMYLASQLSAGSLNSAAGLATMFVESTSSLKDFLLKHAGIEERSQFFDWALELRGPEDRKNISDSDLSIVIPAFVISELKKAFQIGFLIFLPFLVLDMLVANVLLALGMQTLSPSQVSLPFKILLFVSADGWILLSRGLILGYR